MTDFQSLPDVARVGAQCFGPHPALRRTQATGGGGPTYAELWDMVRAGARTLSAAGLATGDAVIFAAPPQPTWTVGLLAILEAGLVAVPLGPGLDATAARGVALMSGARAAVVDGAVEFGPLPTLRLASLFASADGAESRRPTRDDVAMLVFTSGSTANPRAVELTHGNLLADLESMLALRRAAPGDAFLSMLPPSHLLELIGGTLGPLACGARVVYPGALLPNRLVAALKDERITHALAVPALVDALFREVRAAIQAAGVVDELPPGAGPTYSAQWLRDATPERRAAVRDAVRDVIGPTLRTLIVGGASLWPAWGEVLAAVGVRLEVGYGLTEASPIVSMGAADACPPGSVGRPLSGVEVSIGADGEILVRGANVMRGYFRDDAATRAAFVDGRLRTGDVGRVDADGFLFVEGRIKEAMVSATGETVYPEEMEPRYASPLFAEWFVVPARGPDGNDVPTLVVWPADPRAADPAGLRAEFARLRAAAPPRLRVADLRVMLDPPLRTATGKVRRRALGEAISPPTTMRHRDVLPELRSLIGDVTKRDASKLGEGDDLFAALLLDSLEALRLLAFVEKRFGVRFDDAEIHAVRTLSHLAGAVERRQP